MVYGDQLCSLLHLDDQKDYPWQSCLEVYQIAVCCTVYRIIVDWLASLHCPTSFFFQSLSSCSWVFQSLNDVPSLSTSPDWRQNQFWCCSLQFAWTPLIFQYGLTSPKISVLHKLPWNLLFIIFQAILHIIRVYLLISITTQTDCKGKSSTATLHTKLAHMSLIMNLCFQCCSQAKRSIGRCSTRRCWFNQIYLWFSIKLCPISFIFLNVVHRLNKEWIYIKLVKPKWFKFKIQFVCIYTCTHWHTHILDLQEEREKQL